MKVNYVLLAKDFDVQLWNKSVYRHATKEEGEEMTTVLICLLPVSCFLFVNNLVSVIEKVHKDDINLGFNTIGATFGLLLITGAIIAVHF